MRPVAPIIEAIRTSATPSTDDWVATDLIVRETTATPVIKSTPVTTERGRA
jgi:hypothetical protein